MLIGATRLGTTGGGGRDYELTSGWTSRESHRLDRALQAGGRHRRRRMPCTQVTPICSLSIVNLFVIVCQRDLCLKLSRAPGRASGFRLYSTLVEAAVNGLGAAIGRPMLIARELEHRTLVPVFDRQAEVPERCCFITTAASRQRPEVQAFRPQRRGHRGLVYVVSAGQRGAEARGPVFLHGGRDRRTSRRTADRRGQRVRQRPAISRADGTVPAAVWFSAASNVSEEANEGAALAPIDLAN